MPGPYLVSPYPTLALLVGKFNLEFTPVRLGLNQKVAASPKENIYVFLYSHDLLIKSIQYWIDNM